MADQKRPFDDPNAASLNKNRIEQSLKWKAQWDAKTRVEKLAYAEMYQETVYKATHGVGEHKEAAKLRLARLQKPVSVTNILGSAGEPIIGMKPTSGATPLETVMPQAERYAAATRIYGAAPEAERALRFPTAGVRQRLAREAELEVANQLIGAKLKPFQPFVGVGAPAALPTYGIISPFLGGADPVEAARVVSERAGRFPGLPGPYTLTERPTLGLQEGLVGTLVSRARMARGGIFPALARPGVSRGAAELLRPVSVMEKSLDVLLGSQRYGTTISSSIPYGTIISGAGKDIRSPMFFAGMAFGAPAPVLGELRTLTGAMRPGYLGGGPAAESLDVLYGMRVPIGVAQGRAVLGSGPEMTIQSIDDIVAMNLYGSARAKTAAATYKRAMGDYFKRTGAYATQFYRHEVSTIMPDPALGMGHLPVSTVGLLAGGQEANKIAKTMGYYSAPQALWAKEKAFASQLVEETWDKELFFGFSSADAIKDQAKMSTKSMGSLFVFGDAADWGRQAYQETDPGKLIKSLLSSDVAKGRLVGGRVYEPYLSTAVGEAAEIVQQSVTGAPSGAYAWMGMVSPKMPKGMTTAEYKKILKSGKLPVSMFLDTAEMSDVLVRKRLHDMLKLDVSEVTALTTPEGIVRAGATTIEPSGRGQAYWFQGMKATELGTTEKLFETVKGLEGVDILSGFYDYQKKYPLQYRQMYLQTIMEQMGPVAAEGTKYRAAQENLLGDITRILAGKKEKRLPGGAILGGLNAEQIKAQQAMFGTDTSIIEKFYGKEGPPTYEWMQTATGQKVWRMRIPPTAALNAPEIEAVATSIDRYNKMGEVGGFADIARGGFITETIDFGGVETTLTKAVVKAQRRLSSHAIEGVLGMVRPTATGFAEGAKGGISAATLMHMSGTNLKAGVKAADYLRELVGRGQPEAMKELAAEFGQVMASLAGGTAEAYEAIGKLKPGEYFRETAEEITMKGTEGAAAFRKWLEAGPKGEPAGVKAMKFTDTTTWQDLMENTFFSKLYGKRVRFVLDQPQMLGWGELGKGTQARVLETKVKEIVIPRFQALEKRLRRLDKIGQIGDVPVLREAQEVISNMMTGTFLQSKGAMDTFMKQVGDLQATVMGEFIGKDKLMHRLFEPKLAGSGYFSLAGALESSASDLAKDWGAGVALRHAQVGMHPDDLRLLGASQVKGQPTFGLVIAHPEQGVGNVIGVQYVEDPKLAPGTVSTTKLTALAGFRDRDYDRVVAIVNPFDHRKNPGAWKEWNSITGSLYEEWGSILGRAGIYNTDGTIKNVDAIFDNIMKVSGGPDQMGKVAQFSDAVSWARSRADTFADIRTGLASDVAATRLEAFSKASKESPGLLYQWLARRPGESREAAKLAVAAATNTKLNTGFVVNALVHHARTSNALMKAAGGSEVATANMLGELAGTGARARTGMNFIALMSQVRQRATIKKGAVSDLTYLDQLERFAKLGREDKLRGYVSDLVASVQSEAGAGVLNGLDFMYPDVADASGKVLRERQAAHVTDELMGHIKDVTGAIGKEDLWDQGAFARAVQLKHGRFADAERLNKEVMARMFDVSKAYSGEGAVMASDKAFLELGRAMGFDDMTHTHTVAAEGFAAEAAATVQNQLQEADAVRDAIQEAVGTKSAPVGAKLDSATAGAVNQQQRPKAPGTAGKVFGWFMKPKAATDKFFYMKRVGAVAGVGLLGAAFVKSAFWPHVVPDESRSSSYVDIRPSMSGMKGGMNLGGFVDDGGQMPAVYPPMYDKVGPAIHPIRLGAGIKPQRGLPVRPDFGGPAPLPPSDFWSSYDPPSQMPFYADTGHTTVHVSSDNGMQKPVRGLREMPVRSYTANVNTGPQYSLMAESQLSLDTEAGRWYNDLDIPGVPRTGAL